MTREQRETDSSGLKGPTPGGKPWLNSVDVANQLVREFASNALRNIGRPDLEQRLEFDARRLNNLFLGITETSEYERGPWNSPEFCGEHVSKALRINGETRLAVRDALMIFAAKLLEATTSASGPEDPVWRAAMDQEVAVMRSALVGIPVTL